MPLPYDDVTASAAGGLHSMAMTAAAVSLLVMMVSLLFGRSHPRTLVNSVAACTMFSIAGVLLPADGDDPASTATQTIDWSAVAMAVAAVAGIAIVAVATWFYGRHALRARREKAKRRRLQEEALRDETDPIKVARTLLPDMVKDVRCAMERIETLRTLSARMADQEDADALVLVNRRVPSVMEMYRTAAQASVGVEKIELARTALASVIEIGQAAEDTRARIASNLRDQLAVETRYVSTRIGSSGLLRSE